MTDAIQSTHCLLCSLACPVAFAGNHGRDDEQVVTEYMTEDALTQGRLCFRGHYLAEMAAHPFRLTFAEMRDRRKGGSAETVPLARAVETLASGLQGRGGNVAVIVSGRLPTEDILCALQFGREVVGSDLVCVWLPESDVAMLRGIDPGVALLPFDDVAACDVLLAIGDVFATHPVVSRPILESRAARKTRLFAMDCTPNHVAGFAEKFVRVTVGAESAALAALCRLLNHEIPSANAWANGCSAADLAGMAGVDESALRPIAEAISQAESPAILLDPVSGRMANMASAAAIASALCKGQGMRLMPMFQCGNALGAARAAAQCGAKALGEVMAAVLDGKVGVLFSIGVDLMRLLSPEDGTKLRNRVSTLAVASAFVNRSTENADIVLPLAAWFEAEGHAIDATGKLLDLTALLAPPGGAMTARDLCAQLASSAGAALPEAVDLSECEGFLGCPPAEIMLGDESSPALRLVARADVKDFDHGSVSRALAWPALFEPEPELYMSAADVKARGLAPRSCVRVRANGHEASVRLRIAPDIPEGTAAVSAAFDATRTLFRSREYDGAQASELTWSEAEVTAETES